MPSYVGDENLPIYASQNSAVVHLDPSRRYQLSPAVSHENQKATIVIDVSDRQLHQSSSQTSSNDSFDETSSHSTNDSSDSCDRRPNPNLAGDGDDCYGRGPAPMTMSETSNAPLSGGRQPVAQGSWPDSASKHTPNGVVSMTTLPYRTSSRQKQQQLQPPQQPPPPIPYANGARGRQELDSASPGAGDTSSSKLPAGSTTATSPQQSFMTERPSAQFPETEWRVSDGAPNLTADMPQGTASPFTSSGNVSQLVPKTPSPGPSQRHPTSPHRFSSPPIYHPSASATTSAPFPNSIASLKHRHTLEVPKFAPNRTSRDGEDAGMTTGRFSPTSANNPVGTRRASLSLARRNTRSMQSDLPREEIVPDEDALRWAEALRQKRASKRKRREEEDDDRVLVGTKVDESHANWVTAYNMLTGIRVSVSRTNAKLDRPLTDEDFQAKQKSTFDIAGNELVPSAKYDFKFKDYAPWVFRHLRALFRLDPADYLMSLTGKYILSELGSPGKSGSFFYFSRDYKYIIKTIHHAEHKFLRKILKDYYQHVQQNPNTLLSQFYGLHRVKMPYGKKIHFVVMNNLFPPHRDIHQTFDLKGSTIGRDYKEEELERNPRGTMKDLNWLRRSQHLELGIQKKKLFLEQLQKDVRLLQKLEIMDYSLLVGIHDGRRGNEENLRDKTLRVFNPGGDNQPDDYDPHAVLMRTPSKLENQRKARELRQMIKAERPIPLGQAGSKMPSVLEDGQRADMVFYKDDGGMRATHEDNSPGDEIYYLGVIDCLTHYGMIKKIENFWKGLSHDRSQISAQPPHQYGERFLNFISGITISEEEAHRQAQERDAAAAAEAARQERVGSWQTSSTRRRSAANVPPVPSHQPPPPPPPGKQPASGTMFPEADATIRRAEREAWREDPTGTKEDVVPNLVLRTTDTAAATLPSAMAAASPAAAAAGGLGNLHYSQHGLPIDGHIRRDSSSAQNHHSQALSVVDEAGPESSNSNGFLSPDPRGTNRVSQLTSRSGDSDFRPLTPAKDGDELAPGFGNPVLSYQRDGRHGGPVAPAQPPPPPPTPGRVPPPPPNSNYTRKPESADSGYGGVEEKAAAVAGGNRSGGATQGTRVKAQISRDSLDKELPPLPNVDGVPT